MRCPRPIIESAKLLSSMAIGGAITLLSDDPATWIDLKAWARMTSNEVAQISGSEFLITKKS